MKKMIEKYKYFTDENIPSLEEVLENRENRIEKIRSLQKSYTNKPILGFKLNIPGSQKTNDAIIKIFKIGLNDIKLNLDKDNILYEKSYKLNTGPECFMVVDNDEIDLKKKMVNIEDNRYFGRLYDIDINYNGKNIDRKIVGENSRKCFLCNNYAKVCARSRKHSVGDMIRLIEKMIDEYEEIDER
ncbi:MAG: citrate lyase holo-[acyl-carrier protein] synthase [Anaerococcus sp.]|nr:citrate lyase holo-[acyl-carrier protein] synthase [Anaerococcus sp.]